MNAITLALQMHNPGGVEFHCPPAKRVDSVLATTHNPEGVERSTHRAYVRAAVCSTPSGSLFFLCVYTEDSVLRY